MSTKDYYQILGVSSRADEQAIRQAFRQLARRYHPDVNPRSKAKFQEINEAYQVLSDTTKRARYDRLLREMAQIVATPARTVHASPPATHSYPKHRDPRKTTATPIVSTHEKLTGITLVIFVLFCGVLAFSFYHLANFLSGDGSNVLHQATLTRNEWITQTAIRGATATAQSIPTSTAAPERRQLALTSNLTFEELIAEFRAESVVGCSINLAQNEQTCGLIDWNGSPAQIVVRTGPTDGEVNLRLNLDPRTHYLTRVVFVITYNNGRAPSGLTVNISDSDDNDGYSRSRLNGDNNSQIAISGTSMTIHSNTYAPRQLSELVNLPEFVAAGSTVMLEISDQRVRWWTVVGGESLDSQYVFALGGQSETIRDVNYDIFAAFNGAVKLGSTASGRGVEQIDIMLLPAN
jgi:curved DNA-binding protein CbpA